jgi:hypothetical protein
MHMLQNNVPSKTPAPNAPIKGGMESSIRQPEGKPVSLVPSSVITKKREEYKP